MARRRPGPPTPALAGILTALSDLFDMSGQFAKSNPLFRELLEQARNRHGEASPQVSDELAPLGRSLLLQGKYADAEALLRECLAIREKTQPDAWNTFSTRSTLGGSLLGQKKYAEAESLLLAGYKGMKQREEKIPPRSKSDLTEALERLVQLYDALGQKEKAAEWRKKLPVAKPAKTRND
jgi:tetratricopeptide (TPR) repeat protein